MRCEMNKRDEEGLRMYQAKFVENQVHGRWVGSRTKVAQKVLKHILVLEFLKSDILKIGNFR